MRWPIVRLIWFRELRDQVRDRRTVFMIAVLPVLLYPVLGNALVSFALGVVEKPSVVSIHGREFLPPETPQSAVRAAALLSVTPVRLDLALGALAHEAARRAEYPPLLVNNRLPTVYFDSPSDARQLVLRLPPGDAAAAVALVVPSDFRARLEAGERPVLEITYRDSDERGRIAARRLLAVLTRWKQQLREVRLQRRGLPADFDETFEVRDPERNKSSDKAAAEGVLDLLGKVFPFLLVMWSLAGALYPAVDLCAGEKERGTMETLLISPASREEIVVGKFLTIWVFSFTTALLNLASMGLTTWQLTGPLTQALPPTAIFWCVVLALPMSAFFSAVCLAIGAYARSTKEGQYYLMPLFLVTIPLIFLALAADARPNPFYSLIPVTGVALLMQLLMKSPYDPALWLYFVPVLAPTALYSWLALRWAIEQFNREEVLFREAERLDLGLWLRKMLRDKEPTPSTGQALFCFALLLLLHWLSFSLGNNLDLPDRIAVTYLAFVAAPPLLMAVVLTTRPRQGLLLRLPTYRAALGGVFLAVLLLPPLSGLTLYILEQFPQLMALLTERNPLTEELRALAHIGPTEPRGWQYGMALAVLPALCEEVAFRGFILSGLRRRFRPWTAILLSSFLFALFHMNVFQALPAFVLGAVLAILAVRTGSLLPGIIFHLIHNGLVIGLVRLEAWLEDRGYRLEDYPAIWQAWLVGGVFCTLVAAAFFWRLTYFGYHRFAREDRPVVMMSETED